MSRVSKQQAQLNRAAIERESSRLFREKGINGVSVADLMAAAGLTHGGFYGHFPSKDALAAVACATAFEQSAARWKKRISDSADPKEALTSIVADYLCTRSRNAAGLGCPVSALATDVAREPTNRPVREAFLAGVNDLLEILVGLQPTQDESQARTQALGQLATLVGGLILARATSGDGVSEEFLSAARERLERD